MERRHPDAVVGGNPFAARLLQFARRHEIPLLSNFIQTLLNCSVACRLTVVPQPQSNASAATLMAVMGR